MLIKDEVYVSYLLTRFEKKQRDIAKYGGDPDNITLFADLTYGAADGFDDVLPVEHADEAVDFRDLVEQARDHLGEPLLARRIEGRGGMGLTTTKRLRNSMTMQYISARYRTKPKVKSTH